MTCVSNIQKLLHFKNLFWTDVEMFCNLCVEHVVLVSRRFPVQESRKKYRKEGSLSSFPVCFLADLTSLQDEEKTVSRENL